MVTLPGDRPGFDDDGLLHLWRIEGKNVEHIVGFAPYVMNAGSDAVPTWSTWLDEERLFTVNDEGQLILWRVKDATAIYELMVESRAKPMARRWGRTALPPAAASDWSSRPSTPRPPP